MQDNKVHLKNNQNIFKYKIILIKNKKNLIEHKKNLIRKIKTNKILDLLHYKRTKIILKTKQIYCHQFK